ncbi:regulator of G-protein signaling 14 isoform X1 [Cygnus atratus]|uniref:regulator of G-protein signaling 14 isoform X1 n=1 Tax=Cygnus atratus TaxID=8868 RepID=UPI0015D59846|nr:regulator of G-protein signaling 14 isoform X1 [Cygnus atratus]
MQGKGKLLLVHNGRMGPAVSDGELNASRARGSNHSVNSLPAPQTTCSSAHGSVGSWAESFETLLQDRVAVTYFTEFLKKEFSAENVYFWQACERFQQIPASDTQQLAQEARRIYDEFLSSHSVSPINIDRQAWIGEEMLATPSPDMFRLQQLQIFNLMKFDSYTRFVKSPLYQACLRAESQGQPLPDLRPHSRSSSPPPDLSKKSKLKLGKSLPLGVETAGSGATRSPRRSFRKGERREPSWAGRHRVGQLGTAPSPRRPHPRVSVCPRRGRRRWKRRAVERVPGLPQLLRQPGPGLPLLGQHGRQPLDGGESSPGRPRAATGPADGGSPVPQGHRKSLGGSEAEAKPTKYCCVYLPDGTASLAAVRPGLSIRDMLAGICEKRGFSLPDIKVYLVGNEQKALVLDQECCVLADQEVKLENRISFDLEISSLSKTIRITAKSTKRIREALQPVLGKYGVNVELVLLRRQGESAALDLEKLVSTVAAQKLVLETPADMRVTESAEAAAAPSPLRSEEGSPTGAEADAPWGMPSSSCRSRSLAATNLNRRTYDLEGLVELLNRAQSCRANDQRGLLSKEDLVLPDFLQLPGQDGSACGGSDQPSAPHPGSEGNNHPGPAEEPAPAQPAVEQEPR